MHNKPNTYFSQTRDNGNVYTAMARNCAGIEKHIENVGENILLKMLHIN